MDLANANKLAGTLRNVKAYLVERDFDRLQGFPFQKPPLKEQVDAAIELLDAELEALGAEEGFDNLYDAGTMYS
ncbi:MAG: hypothetical protein KAI86_10180 [Desulfobacterales bacterium]|nr:hypothetical protein [Desulfobacterales bacterium]